MKSTYVDPRTLCIYSLYSKTESTDRVIRQDRPHNLEREHIHKVSRWGRGVSTSMGGHAQRAISHLCSTQQPSLHGCRGLKPMGVRLTKAGRGEVAVKDQIATGLTKFFRIRA